VGVATLAGSGVPLQLKVVSVAPGSVAREALPSSVTEVVVAPPDNVTVRFIPALAIGAVGARTVIVTRSGTEDRLSTGLSTPSSVTVNANSKVAPDGITGAVKVGRATAGFDKAATGPET
jgi:hypothetical protein